ncbi:MAG: hypothetical protein CMM31_00705 [Rhodospirillaceae bacterium]|nr:hypothetical protein [Rhodospirillaceae bacterium]
MDGGSAAVRRLAADRTQAIHLGIGLAGLRRKARIGLNIGEMLVGNIGSRWRFNYTVMGDAANLAALLKGANKSFGSSILVSESTARACGDTVVMCDRDLVRVVGREAPIAVYEPLCLSSEADAAVERKIAGFEAALKLYRAREFAAAAAALEALGTKNGAAAKLAARARDMAADPPGADWRSVNDLVEK